MIPMRSHNQMLRLRDGGGPRLDIRHSSSTDAPGGGEKSTGAASLRQADDRLCLLPAFRDSTLKESRHS
jgi:hypothetical protein